MKEPEIIKPYQDVANIRKALLPLVKEIVEKGDLKVTAMGEAEYKTFMKSVRKDIDTIAHAIYELADGIEKSKPSDVVQANVDFTSVEKSIASLKEATMANSSNLKELKKSELKVEGLESLRLVMAKALQGINKMGTDKSDPTDYMNVRLTDGKDFYNAISRSIATAMEGTSNTPFLKNDGVTPARVILNADGSLPTSGGGGGSSGTQYSSGTSTPSPVVGNALIYDNSGTLANVSVSNPLPVSATISTSGIATSSNQINGTQKTQIVDGSGNVITSTSGSLNVQPTKVADSQTTGTVTGTGTFVIGTNGYSTIGFQVTGTWSGTITIEASLDGTNWIATSYVALTSGNTSSNFSANTIGQINTTSLQNIRFRGNTVSSGTANLNVWLSDKTSNVMLDNSLPQGTNVIGKVGIDQTTPGTTNGVVATGGDLTSGSQVTKLSDGTNTANVLKSDGTAAGQNSELTAPTYLSVPFTTTTAQAVGSTDAGNYRYVSVSVSSQGTSSVVNFQASNDNSNWYAVTLNAVDNTSTQTGQSTTSTTHLWAGALHGRYFRINVTGISSGTTTGTIVFSAAPTVAPAYQVINVNSATGSTVPSNAFYQGIKNTGGNLDAARYLSTNADGTTVTAGGNVQEVIADSFAYNGTGWDRTRTANAASNTTGTGLLGAGALGIARTSEQSANTNAYWAGLVADKVGKLISLPYANPENFVKGSANATGTTSTSLVGAAGTGVKNYITSVFITNTGTNNSLITLQDGNAGTTLLTTIAPAGGGSNITLPVPIATSSNTALYFAAGTSSTTIYLTAVGYTGV